MTMPVLWQGPSQIVSLTNTFMVAGVPTDPDTISCTVTDPNGNSVTHTYQATQPADIFKISTGTYQVDVAASPGPGPASYGIWAYAWVGTGAASEVVPGTFTTNPVNLNQYYTSAEELKYRLGLDDTEDDPTIIRAVRAASKWVEGHCHRHFYPMTDTRTYPPYSIWELPVDDIVSITSLAIDRDGDGTFEEHWVQGTDYELAISEGEYNQMAAGEPWPYTLIRVIAASGSGGNWFPYTWPFSRLDRIQIQGVFGWPAVPEAIRDAALQVASDIYRRKEAPFGVVGVGGGGMNTGAAFDFGTTRVPRINPAVIAQLTRYVRGRKVAV